MTGEDEMDKNFAQIVNSLHPKYEKLIAASPTASGNHAKDTPMKGVYLFSEEGRHLYVGRTNNLKSRYGGHTRPSSKDQSAPFAFKLACRATGTPHIAKERGITRKKLMEKTKFHREFLAAKSRIRMMEFRWVEEADPIRQALLEAYCCIALKTEFNDFENH